MEGLMLFLFSGFLPGAAVTDLSEQSLRKVTKLLDHGDRKSSCLERGMLTIMNYSQSRKEIDIMCLKAAFMAETP